MRTRRDVPAYSKAATSTDLPFAVEVIRLMRESWSSMLPEAAP
jgi:hypothetical protein